MTQQKFWSRVKKTKTCWLWQGYIGKDGYGRLSHEGKQVTAHRFAFGKVRAGLTLDHLCRVRHCVNPAHLEAVTNYENAMRGFGVGALHARQTHCVNGHPLTGRNLCWRPGKYGKRWRACRACRTLRQRKYRKTEPTVFRKSITKNGYE